MRPVPQARLCLILGFSLLVLMAASLSVGRVWVPFSAWLAAGDDPRWSIIFALRLPRTVLAVMVGGSLGLAGAALQGYTRNPLADPGVIGVSSTAALGAVLTLYLGVAGEAVWMLPAAAMAGAGAGVALLLALAGATSSVITFILAGVIVQTVASAGVALALNLAPNPWSVNEIVNWIMGSLADRSLDEVKLAAPGVLAGCVLMLTTGRALDALTMGETGARAAGVDLKIARWILAVGVACAVGASVAVTGVIGFVGLITPHLLRPLVGGRPGGLLAPAFLGGAALTLAADMVVRMTPAASEVKLGVAMAVIGGPFFLGLLIALRRRMA